MKTHILQLIKHPLIMGSSIMVLGSLAGNVFNFLFNVYMIRTLSIVDYGILASIISLITLPSLAAGAIIPTVVSFAGSYFAKNNLDMASSLFFKISKYFLIIGVLLLSIFVIFSNALADFLQIPNGIFIILAGIVVLIGFMSSVNTAFLQARLAFKFIVSVNFFSAFVKLLLGILLVSVGFSVGGAIWALLLSFAIPYILSFIPLSDLFHKSVKKVDISRRELMSYGLPAAFCVLSLTSFITSDILLVKHFFTPFEAGVYASLSLIARIIFFISGPVTSVMFPLVVQRHSRNERYNHLFLASLAFVILPSVCITVIYFSFPNFIIQFFFKEGNPVEHVSLLGYFGIFITLYAVVSLVTNYLLSIKKTNVFIPVSIAALAQIVVISLYHSDFFQIIFYSTLVLSLLLVVLLLYYCKIHFQNTNETK